MDMNNINNCLSFNVNPNPLTSTSHHNPRNKRARKTPQTSKTKPMNNTVTCRPCSECGKKFRSWKALFGHMRCHPERQWRGINPPPNFRRHPPEPTSAVTEEDHEVATCLLMLAGGPTAPDQSPSACTVNRGIPEVSDSGRYAEENVLDEVGLNYVISCGFECSTCKKVVFGSDHPAISTLATHKNNIDGEKLIEGCCGEKEASASAVLSGSSPSWGLGLDLNYPAPAVVVEYDDASSSSSLELRLGL